MGEERWVDWFHSFSLEDKHLLQTCLKRLARKDYVPTKHSKLCSLHFKFEDFVTDSTDQKGWRKKRETATLIRKRLRKDACPSIFKDLPSYYTQNNYLVRSELSRSSSRFKNEAARLEEQNEVF